MPRVLLAAIVVGGLFSCYIAAGEKDGPISETKGMIYFVKHGEAKDFADALNEQFKGDAHFQVIPRSVGSCLLITAGDELFDEVLRVLDQLDRPPRLVSVDLFVVVLKSRANQASPTATEVGPNRQRFAGPTDAILANIRARKKDGSVTSFTRIQLAAIENQRTLSFVNETRSYIQGTARTAQGTMHQTASVDLGTQIAVTPRVSPDDLIVLDVQVSGSRLSQLDKGVQTGTAEVETSPGAPEIVRFTLDCRLRVPPGEALLAQGIETNEDSQQAETLIIVGAHHTAVLSTPLAKPTGTDDSVTSPNTSSDPRSGREVIVPNSGTREKLGPAGFLHRLDANSNGMLDPNEVEGRFGDLLKRITDNNPNIDLSRPVPLDRLEQELQLRMGEDRIQAGDAPPTSGPGTPYRGGSSRPRATPATIESSYQDYFRRLVAKFDKNGDGHLERDEWTEMSRNPEAADVDGDGRVTVEEYARWARPQEER